MKIKQEVVIIIDQCDKSVEVLFETFIDRLEFVFDFVQLELVLGFKTAWTVFV